MSRHREPEKTEPADAMKRMNEALKAALKTPPRKHKDEPKRRTSGPAAKPSREAKD